jgi:hypothetical protein
MIPILPDNPLKIQYEELENNDLRISRVRLPKRAPAAAKFLAFLRQTSPGLIRPPLTIFVPVIRVLFIFSFFLSIDFPQKKQS